MNTTKSLDTNSRPVNDAYSPSEVASMIENIGVLKARMPVSKILVLAVLAGAFIAFGAMLYTVVITDSQIGYGPTRWLGGVAFSLGLILVVVAGAELFTGNNLIVMAWASKRISRQEVLQNWVLVLAGNMLGAVATAWLVSLSGVLDVDNGVLAHTAIGIADNKMRLNFGELFVRGILCNALVCLAVWLCMAAHSVSGKIVAIIFPVSAFVALGFEHSIANMYFIPLGIFLGSEIASWSRLVSNLFPVTLGNIVGGSVLVAFVYWLSYLKE